MGNEPALSFGAAAELYDRIRPTYPAEALRWALDGAGRRIVDLGAGTGIMTRVLVSLGYEVTAVEPDTLMRTRLLTASPGITALAGAAESIPLPEGSVDGVVAAQAYHWFDPDRALTEIGRVIQPGGVFAAIWNDRDESVPWVAEYADIIEGAGRPSHVSRRRADPDSIQFGPLFGTVEHAAFAHEAKQNAAGLLDLMHSRSHYLTASPRLRAQLDDQVRDLVANHPDLRGRDEFALPYVTTAFRATRR